MIKLLSTFFLISASCFLFAQQDRQLTFYSFDGMSFNPAITGFKGYTGTMIYRNQWDKVENAPNTTLFNVQGNLDNIIHVPGAIGLGLSFNNDAIGSVRQNNLKLNGAYHIQTPIGKFSTGLGLGFLQMAIDGEWITPTDPIAMDPTISNLVNKVAETKFDFNGGLYYTNRLGYIGFSTTHLAEADYQQMSYTSQRHYYVLAGTHFNVGNNRQFELKPSVLIKADGATAVFDFNIRAEYDLMNSQTVWVGATYRFSDGAGLMAGMSLGDLSFGYALEFMTNRMKVWGSGSHELMIQYSIFPPAKKIIRTVCPHILM